MWYPLARGMVSIMDYINQKTSREEIIKQINYCVLTDIGTYVPQWGIFLKKNNINVKIIGSSPLYKKDTFKSGCDIIDEYFNTYLRNDGIIEKQIITNNLIRDLLLSKHILLILLSVKCIYGTSDYPHYCVLYGYKKKKGKEYVMMHDPYLPNHKITCDLQEMLLNKITVGIKSLINFCVDGGFVIAIKPKE